MKKGFVHEAELEMTRDADIRAPGAAITVALCGGWEHEPPCPLAPHHTSARRTGGDVQVTVLFAADSEREALVRARIEQALAVGSLIGPDHVTTRWHLRETRSRPPQRVEADHLARLIQS